MLNTDPTLDFSKTQRFGLDLELKSRKFPKGDETKPNRFRLLPLS